MSRAQSTTVEVELANGNIVMCDVIDAGLVCSDGRFYDDAAEALVGADPLAPRTPPLDPTHAPTIAEDRCEFSPDGVCHRVE